MDRLISAYRNKLDNKFVHTSYFQERFGKQIVKQYRKNAPKLSNGNDVTFKEFFLYLADPGNFPQFNEHWELQYNLCQPCNIPYDFIGHYENFMEEANYVLNYLFIGGRVPAAPFPECGEDASADDIDCRQPPECP